MYHSCKRRRNTYLYVTLASLTITNIDTKPTLIKVEERVFRKETSVFREWKEDTPYSVSQMVDDDFKYWKVYRFCKDDTDVSCFSFLIHI